jgi:hypothetical protein
MTAPMPDYQYILSSGDFTPPPSYRVLEAAGVKVAFDRRFRVVELRDTQQTPFAVMIGFPYEQERGDFLPEGTLTVPLGNGDVVTAFETTVIPRLAGSFILLTFGPLPPRVYLDPGGSLPLVFLAERKIAAASPALILDDAEYAERFQQDLHRATILDEGVGGWISGDLTAHRGVLRVLPNHFLDLVHWKAQRHWPKPEDFRSWMPFEQGVARASEALSRFTSAVARNFSVALTMTAGNDSRLLLASARNVAAQCEFVTFNHDTAKMDVDIAQALSRMAGVKHRVIQVIEADAQQQERWNRAVGDTVVEGNRASHPTLREVHSDTLLTGMYGEIGRCRLYRQDLATINSERIESDFVIERLTLPHHPLTDAAFARWFDGVRGLPNSVILDLAFLELKFGNWAMGQHPAQNALKFHFLPYAQRQVLDSFMGVDPVEKTTERLFSACIRYLWPELCSMPINRYGDYRDHLVKLSKLTRPSRVRRFLRDRFARKN